MHLATTYPRTAFTKASSYCAPLNFALPSSQVCQEKWQCSVYNLPSHHLHHKFVLSLPPHCLSQQAHSRCAFCTPRDMAVFLSTTYHHITSITGVPWMYLRIASHSKCSHAAPCLRQQIWQCFSLQLTFTSPPSQACLEITFALLFTASAFTLRLFFVKWYGSVSLNNIPSHHIHHKFVLSLPW